MNRNKINYISAQNTQKLSKETIAFHEAGHATAIYLNNRTRNIPPVFFKILLNSITNEQVGGSTFTKPLEGDYIAKIEGGRLIQTFSPLHEVTEGYMTAFEADIINVLVGPLAEAKYVHECDDEYFNERLVNIHALNFYGGRLDLQLTSEYIQSLYPSRQEQEKTLNRLFNIAFGFIENHSNWQAISRLANYIYQCPKSVIDYEEVVLILESA